jgi:anaerobic magnesium-protoporphyrin IX monomethyl ester cyclase
MKVLFVELEMERNWSVASIGPAFLAAYVRPLGHTVDIIHLSIETSTQKAVEEIRSHSPDVLAFSLTSRQWLRARGIANLLRSKQYIPTIVGGLHPTFSSEEVLLEPGIDYVCLGEGELAFAKFLELLSQKKQIIGIKNIRGKGQKKPELYNPFDPIDKLPFMSRDLLNEQYGIVHMTTQRGCPFPCSYCAARMYNEMYGDAKYGRRRSIDNVFTELNHLKQQGSVNYIIFLDDTFTVNHKWVQQFCQRYKEEFKIPFSLHARAETINEKMLHSLAEAGCVHITFGVESGSPRLRKEIMKRKVSNERLIQAFKWSQDSGIVTTANYILATPTETREELDQTIELHHKLDPHDFGYFIFYPYPGTPMYQYCKERGLLPEDMSSLPANHRKSILQHDVLTEEDIEEYYQKFTTIREQTYMKRYGQYLNNDEKDQVNNQMVTLASTG